MIPVTFICSSEMLLQGLRRWGGVRLRDIEQQTVRENPGSPRKGKDATGQRLAVDHEAIKAPRTVRQRRELELDEVF